jgi:polysaccharide biosynthesis transport protein
VIPESKALSRSARRAGDGARAVLPPGEAESFHLIRAHLRYFNVDRQVRTLLVASATPGDGKTTIARHLAGGAAAIGCSGWGWRIREMKSLSPGNEPCS